MFFSFYMFFEVNAEKVSGLKGCGFEGFAEVMDPCRGSMDPWKGLEDRLGNWPLCQKPLDQPADRYILQGNTMRISQTKEVLDPRGNSQILFELMTRKFGQKAGSQN